jgi:arabinan endo-1,5-alpha-L-arabinosidase
MREGSEGHDRCTGYAVMRIDLRCVVPIVLGLAACAGSDGAVGQSQSEALAADDYVNPLLGVGGGSYAECPDPNVRRFGANYFMVCTSPEIGQSPNAFPIHWSPDLVTWHLIGYVFSPTSHPRWAKAPGAGTFYWAPELNRVNDKWVVTFAATSSDPSKHDSMAIGAASADAIAGPWTATDEPLVSQGDGSIPGAGDATSGRIDPTLVRDTATGALYLYYVYQPEYVHVAQLADDGLSVVRGTDKALELTTGQAFGATLPWEHDSGGHGVVEGVEAHLKNGEFQLLYSGASTWDGTYAVGVAKASAPYGPFEKRGDPILRSGATGRLVGPGHSSQWVTGPNGLTYLLYHVQIRGQTGHSEPRLLALDELSFDSAGWPTVGDGEPDVHAMATP